jgi:hypothetical protein
MRFSPAANGRAKQAREYTRGAKAFDMMFNLYKKGNIKVIA